MSLLGYLIPRIASSSAEPAATQALVYILSASSSVAKAFVDVVSAALPGDRDVHAGTDSSRRTTREPFSRSDDS